MRGTRYQAFKNASISVLLGVVVMRCISFPDTAAMVFMGYLVAQVTWVMLITYDEIVRQRRKGRTPRHWRTATHKGK